MTLVDTTDGVLMLGAYGWAFTKPIRKLYYNMTITAVSVVVAIVVGGLETLNLIVSAYLDFAELQARSRKPMTMRDWIGRLDTRRDHFPRRGVGQGRIRIR